ncbi:copper chaperone PCu(A)C [Massilia endophytica]|uniref:copper chaperone PCu(A)C n=1 Tax=Massilia endophytica TaxID=2899220 RepID=UPI001E56A439|nr:copper chaperone PCu(A)C [Massilia endophytica]UGQ47900.1 copper chaperone PCu(A)C [Massilia endophytica]
MKQIFFACALSAAFASAQAQVTVRDPWIRATVPAAQATGAFMQLQSAQDTRLVEARTPVAGSAELHQMSMQDNRMRMAHVEGIDLPAGKPVALASGGYHIMLMQLKRQMKEGETVPLTLVFEDRKKKRSIVEVQVPVRPLNYSAH